jgi:hypothetical protein
VITGVFPLWFSFVVIIPPDFPGEEGLMEWSNEMVLTFLDYYGEEPVIWNASHPSHKQRNEVHDAWKRIEEKMGGEVSVLQLKKKKGSLMASFRIVAKRLHHRLSFLFFFLSVCRRRNPLLKHK